MGHPAATPPSVTSMWPGRCNNTANLSIIAARLGTFHRGMADPHSPKINTLRPSGGDPATQGDVNTVDWVLKNISSACVTATERERERGSVCRGSRRPFVDVQGGLCVLSPRGRSQGDVPSLLTIDRRHDKLCPHCSLLCSA